MVRADNGCAVEDGSYGSGDAGVFARIDGSLLAAMQIRERVTEKGFSREACEKRPAECEEFALASQ